MVDSWFPASLPKPAGNYKNKKVEDWGWRDFKNYYDDKYVQLTNNPAPKSFKVAFESTIELRGKPLFKEMIDYMFANRTKYPQWKSLNIGLCLGNHGWAAHIAEQAEKRLSSALEFTEEEV